MRENGDKCVFAPGAIDMIYEHSRGIPRIINLVCDSALLSGYVAELPVIDEKVTAEVIREREELMLPVDIRPDISLGQERQLKTVERGIDPDPIIFTQ